MYIGPWQEYRLAKIQEDAIQRLRREWEAQLRGQLPTGDDDRIRELMQPLMAKLPSLLAPKSRTSGSSMGSITGSSSMGSRNGSRSKLSSEAGSRCSSRPPSARSTASSASVRSSLARSRTSYSRARESGDVSHRHSNLRGENNQDTHDESSSRVAPKPPKPKKKGKAPLTSLDQVQKRKKMFATWIKHAGNGKHDVPEQTPHEANPETKNADETPIVTKLPPIHSAIPASATMLLGQDAKPKIFSSPMTLPPLHNLSISTEETSNTLIPPQTAVMSPRVSTTSKVADIDLDESVDEEEINNLLNWTDTLLSPHAMDSLCDFGD